MLLPEVKTYLQIWEIYKIYGKFYFEIGYEPSVQYHNAMQMMLTLEKEIEDSPQLQAIKFNNMKELGVDPLKQMTKSKSKNNKKLNMKEMDQLAELGELMNPKISEEMEKMINSI